jgi:putative peptide zinc metalloprotease protein
MIRAMEAWKRPYLLVAVLLINLVIVRQTIPFFQLDGDWALADLMGIPDFYSLMGPFVRNVLPIPGQHGRRLPCKKPWVTIVFVAYIIVKNPLFALLMVLLLRGASNLFATLWGALQAQTTALSSAQRNGDLLGGLAAVTQATILGLEIFGLGFFLFKLLWSGVGRAWLWMRRASRGVVI